MTGYYKKAFIELDNKINELLFEQDSLLVCYERVIEHILFKTGKLKEYVIKTGFKNQQEEIHFFKHIKPQFVSKLIYYNAVYKIETKKPWGAAAIKKYLDHELKKLKKFFDNNLDFYKYYRTNSVYLDHKYFLRGKHDIKFSLDTFYFETDHTFSTSHDFKVAKIIANDLIQVYLEDQLYNGDQTILSDYNVLRWTESKTALIELIYSLYAQGVFDNGNVDIKIIAKTFENLFNINLGDFYRTYLELRNRKINRTKFLDTLRDSLIKKMDEQDER